MNMPIAREQADPLVVGGHTFLITALNTTDGFKTMAKMQEFGTNVPDPLFVKWLIMTSVTVDNMPLDERKYELLFSRKIKLAMEVFGAIINFNFADLNEDDPNELADTSAV